MRPLALAALLALAAAPARALDEAELVRLLKDDARSLDGFDQEKSRLDVTSVVVEPLPNLSSAHFDNMKVRVILGRQLLAAGESELSGCNSMPAGKSPEWVLAVHLLPTFMHELRHSYGLTVLGETPNSFEEEVSGFITSMGVYPQARRKWPEAYKCLSPYASGDYKLNLLYWDPEGVEGLERKLKEPSSFYRTACSVRTDAELCRRAAERLYDKVHPLQQKFAEPGADAAELCRRYAAQLAPDACADKEGAVKIFWDAAVAKMFWTSDARVQKARDYYLSQEWPRGRALWSARTGAGP